MLEKASYQNHTIYHHATETPDQSRNQHSCSKNNNNLIVLRDIHITKHTLPFKKIPCAWAPEPSHSLFTAPWCCRVLKQAGSNCCVTWPEQRAALQPHWKGHKNSTEKICILNKGLTTSTLYKISWLPCVNFSVSILGIIFELSASYFPFHTTSAVSFSRELCLCPAQSKVPENEKHIIASGIRSLVL